MTGEKPDHAIVLAAFNTSLEWSKQIVTIASATLVLSATFIKNVFDGQISATRLLFGSWVSLILAIALGCFVIGALASELNDKRSGGMPDVYVGNIRGCAILQVLAFLLGLGLLVGFVSCNLG